MTIVGICGVTLGPVNLCSELPTWSSIRYLYLRSWTLSTLTTYSKSFDRIRDETRRIEDKIYHVIGNLPAISSLKEE